MSKAHIVRGSKETYPFGVIALIFCSISIFGTLFLKHPANDPDLIALSDYLLTMGLVALVIIVAFGIDVRSPDQPQISLLGFFSSFLIGLGLVALLKNLVLATYSAVGVPMDITMFFVATIEELAFRVAIPILVFRFFPMDWDREPRWFAGVVISSFLFGMWHLFAYGADMGLMISALVAGVILSVGYRVGTLFGGGDLAFLGIVAGHYFWNLTASGTVTALSSLLTFIALVIGMAWLINPHFRKSVFTAIPMIRRRIGF
jgi:membrane protease YdiL (CAAX protease family)